MRITMTGAALALAAAPALASPHIDDGGMVHVMIGWDGSAVSAHQDPAMDVPLIAYPGETYDGAAAVLDGTYYSSRYGFLNDGFISLNAGEAVWIERVSATDGLLAYEGGMRSMAEMHTYDAIFAADGDRWRWGGTMHHPWFAADAPGDYQMSFEIYVGDELGAHIDGYASGFITLGFTAVPTPSGVGVVAGVGLIALRRRR